MESIDKAGISKLNGKRFQKLIRRVRIFSVRPLLATALGVLLVLCSSFGHTAEQKALAPPKTSAPSATQTASPAPVPPGPAAIAVTDVATRATDIANQIQAITQKLGPSSATDMIRRSLPDVSRQIDHDLANTMTILKGQPALPTLEALQDQWLQMQEKTTIWLSVLTKESNDLQVALDNLAAMQKTWEVTLKASKVSKAPELTLQQINGTLASIQTAQIPLQKQLTAVLDLQSRVSAEIAKCGDIVAKVAQIQKTSMSEILVQDSLPIISPELWAGWLTELPERISGKGAAYMGNVKKYFQDPAEGMHIHAAFLTSLTLLFFAARYQIRKLTAQGVTFSHATSVFKHPLGAALAVALLIATSPYWSIPIILQRTLQVLAFVPMIVLIRPLVPTGLAKGLYLIWLLIGIDAVREVFAGELLIEQIILMIESLGGTGTMIWILWNLRPALAEAAGSTRLRILQSVAVFVLLVLAFGFGAASMGYVRFARLMTVGMVAGGMLALMLYITLRVLMGMADFAFHVWPLRTLRMLQHNQKMIERRLYYFLILAAGIGWTVRYLNYLGFLQPVLSFAKAVLDAKYVRGDFSISVGSVLEFFITVWAGYLLSSLLRFVLREDVYPRVGIAPGKSYAISSLMHYVIITLGFLAGLAVLGINLTKLTVLTGALGVGIGFGLQGVVNNFVSGLILLFERPIQVGDTVEVGDLLGKVRSIGIRACTVHMRQGADIIVPNSQLVTEKVTNWTLSDMLRRIDLPVGVSYSSTPKEVIKVLITVAIDNPHILADPPPQALFMGYGDSSINFELRAWTDRFDDWQLIRSELATAVFDAVRAAGMSFPFPQREVRILGDAEGRSGTASADPGTDCRDEAKN